MRNTRLALIAVIMLSSSCILGDLVAPEKSDSFFIKRGKIYYSPQGNWFELGYDLCDADVGTFEVMSTSIAKDKNAIFYGCNIQHQIDYESFVIDSKGVPKDKKHVYEVDYSHDSLIPVAIDGLDIGTFEYIGEARSSAYGWTKDKHHFYFKNKAVNVHYATLKFLTEEFYYDRDSLYVSFGSWKTEAIKKINQAPTKLNEKYILSDTALYFVHNESLSLKTNPLESMPTDFRIVSNNVIAFDDKVVYYGHPITHVDAQSFVLVSDAERGSFMKYYKDKNFVYLDTQIIEHANPETFQLIELGYAKDDRHVFYDRTVLKGVDPESFEEDPRKLHVWMDKNGNRYNSSGEKIGQ